MKKVLFIVTMLLALVLPMGCFAAEISDDKMILEWTSSKVWVDKGELLAMGTFNNKRDDLTINKINAINMKFLFQRHDGSTYTYYAKPQKIPFCKLPAKGSKKTTLNFGKFSDTWAKWVTNAEIVFTYTEGVTW